MMDKALNTFQMCFPCEPFTMGVWLSPHVSASSLMSNHFLLLVQSSRATSSNSRVQRTRKDKQNTSGPMQQSATSLWRAALTSMQRAPTISKALTPHEPVHLVRSKGVTALIVRMDLVTEIKVFQQLIVKLLCCVCWSERIIQLHG